MRSQRGDLDVVRKAVAAIFICGSLGTATELVLLEHTEGAWQLLPLVLIGVAALMLGGVASLPRMATVRAFQAVMSLFIASGVIGVALHYQGNVEFEQELRPGATGTELVWEALKGATPTLAPGTMILLGALGLTYTYGHPAAKRPDNQQLGSPKE